MNPNLKVKKEQIIVTKCRTLLISAFVTFLSACSSAPVEPIQYYTLDNVSDLPSEPEMPSRVIVFKTLTLAEYLQQSYLTFQSNSHQLHYASKHIWAENLQTSIEKVLLKELNKDENDIVFIKDSDPRARTAVEYLSVDIEHLLATNNQSIQLAARYWLNMSEEKISKAGVSNVETPLVKSGYASSVKEMRAALTLFATEIKGNIKQW
jgi:uncharacterized lipoprotein YmbA